MRPTKALKPVLEYLIVGKPVGGDVDSAVIVEHRHQMLRVSSRDDEIGLDLALTNEIAGQQGSRVERVGRRAGKDRSVDTRLLRVHEAVKRERQETRDQRSSSHLNLRLGSRAPGRRSTSRHFTRIGLRSGMNRSEY